MALTKINDRGLTTPIDLLDNEKIRLGTGNDIELYHDGSNSIIHNKTGQTWIQGSELYLSSNHVDGQEKYLKATANGSVELYHNDAKKLETTSGGTQITGRLNIGTSTEGHASADELTLENTAADMGMTLRSGTNNQGAIYFSDGTSGDAEYRGIVLYNHANDAFSIYTSATERFRLDSTGRLSAGKAGVGSYNDASEWFKVQSNDSAANISIVGSNDTHSSLNLGDEDDFNIQKIKSDHSNNSLQFYTDNSERIRIDSSGKIGIGLTNPVNNLDVSGSVSATGNMLNTAYADGVYIGTNGGLPAITAGKASNSAYAPLVFRQDHQAAGAERMRISTNGEVGINITNPEAYGANGHAYAGLTVEAPSGNYSGITIKSAYNGAGGLMFSDGSGSTGELYNVALTADHVNKRLNFYIDGSTVCRLTEHGFHPNPSDSAAANALDDYEEGTWTPAVTGGIDGGAQYISQYGWYTKVGRFVHASFYFQFVDATTGSQGNGNQAIIGGLPFAVGNITSYTSGGLLQYNSTSMSGSSQVFCYLQYNASTIWLYRDRNNSATWTTGANDNKGKTIYGTVSYAT